MALNDYEIETFLNIPIESEDEYADGFELSDDEDINEETVTPREDRVVRVREEDNDVFTLPEYFLVENENVSDQSTSGSPVQVQTSPLPPSSQNVNFVQTSTNTMRVQRTRITRCDKNAAKKQVKNPILHTKTRVVRPTWIKELYSTQVDPSKPFILSKTELQRFLGILIMMSIDHVPNSRSYWSDNLVNMPIKNCMSVNHFERIKRFLHFNNNNLDLPPNHEDRDRLFKIRPIVELLKAKFSSVPFDEFLALDEQLCPTKARSYMKQYLPLKPHKWGYKLFVLCGVKGYAYNFEIYTGNENNSVERQQMLEPDLGATGNVVVRLSRVIPRNEHHKLYFDNYYTSIPVMVYLEKLSIHTVGTFRRNRFPDIALMPEKEMMKKPRGTYDECLTVVDGVPITTVSWKDNKIVNVTSTFIGALEPTTVRRYDKKQKKNVDVERPKIIEVYNKHMGGVDLMDSLIGRYRIIMRSKKWYIKIFYHLLDMTVVNSWLMYKKITGNTMPLAKFREHLSVTLMQSGIAKRGKGRPSGSFEIQENIKKKRTQTPSAPFDEIRRDCLEHWPNYEQQRRCEKDKPLVSTTKAK
ncbi:piggyBac transposable element-derived protein 3-like [Myzus persicae]|uniref:piggyBac transposable element-derived protein 3-like n=1 Tax=Myzus persicae TaxID=13164 RepID=UPI000B939E22|nr:piggyBac transposable element-derived protein 3-like [Myzus persicae]